VSGGDADIAFSIALIILLGLGAAIFLTWLESVTERWVPIASLLGVMAIGFVILEKSEPIAHLISQKLKKLWVFDELLHHARR
jgi:hypothetical protein